MLLRPPLSRSTTFRLFDSKRDRRDELSKRTIPRDVPLALFWTRVATDQRDLGIDPRGGRSRGNLAIFRERFIPPEIEDGSWLLFGSSTLEERPLEVSPRSLSFDLRLRLWHSRHYHRFRRHCWPRKEEGPSLVDERSEPQRHCRERVHYQTILFSIRSFEANCCTDANITMPNITRYYYRYCYYRY